ncbi:hypothetical protein OHD37_00055 [Escherichia coli]|nr:hypothetical protein [Escherichia coli]
MSGAFIEAFFEVDNDFEVNVIIGAAGKGEPEEIQVVKVAQLISVP